MTRSAYTTFDDQTLFHNMRLGTLPFGQVFEAILEFLLEDPAAHYCISVGSDSQSSGRDTLFVTCILVHRVGKGAIGFYSRNRVKRSIRNLREKLSLETLSSLQLTYLFDDTRIARIYDVLHRGTGDISFEFHIDIGRNGPTSAYITEMMSMARGLVFIPRIKPESYCASSYADRHSKAT